MSSKATFSAAAAAVIAGTVLISGQSFAASTPAPAPSTTRPAADPTPAPEPSITRPAADPTPVPVPSETRAPRAEPVRRTPHFTG